MPAVFVHPFSTMNDAAILQIFALAYLAVGVGGLVDPKMAKELLRDFQDNRALAYLGGLFGLIIGYAVIVTRGEISGTPEIVLAVLGWIALVKGLALMAFPIQSMKMGAAVLKPAFVTHMFPYFALLLS